MSDFSRWDAIAVGDFGGIWTNAGDQPVCSGTRETLRSVHTSSSEIWAVGANNTVVRLSRF